MTEKAAALKNYCKLSGPVSSIKAKKEIGPFSGISVLDDGYRIPFLNQTYSITTDRIVDADGKTATNSATVILCKYLLLCPDIPSNDINMVIYKNFKDAAPYHALLGVPAVLLFHNADEDLSPRQRFSFRKTLSPA